MDISIELQKAAVQDLRLPFAMNHLKQDNYGISYKML